MRNIVSFISTMKHTWDRDHSLYQKMTSTCVHITEKYQILIRSYLRSTPPVALQWLFYSLLRIDRYYQCHNEMTLNIYSLIYMVHHVPRTKMWPEIGDINLKAMFWLRFKQSPCCQTPVNKCFVLPLHVCICGYKL